MHFVDGYLDNSGLARLITSADMYLLPYDNNDQVTSGVLSEAMVAGGPVIATRFPHAVELLGDGAGILIKHQSPNAIAEAVRGLIRDSELRQQMRFKTAAKAGAFLWPAVGASMSTLLHAVMRGSIARNFPEDHQAQVPA